MDKQKHLKTLSSQSFLIAVLFSACVNQIETEIVKESSIPINFSAGIKQAVSTRVTDAGLRTVTKSDCSLHLPVQASVQNAT